MKRLYNFILLFASLSLGLGATAQTVYNYTGSLQYYVVPAGVGNISIQCVGAEGGNGTTANTGTPGKGADMYGEFTVTPGQTLAIMVGEEGSDADHVGGGGGGSFVWDDGTSVLFIAAGGGGGGGKTDLSDLSNVDGLDASITEDGTNGAGMIDGAGTAGNGGTVPTCINWASGGAGWLTDGADGSLHGCASNSTGGSTPLTGGAGGSGGGWTSAQAPGGYGGGGGGNARCGAVGGGGGGGYSGGGAGGEIGGTGNYNAGGGGGSYNSGSAQVNVVSTATGSGQVIITELCTGLTYTVSDDTVCVGDEVTLDATSTLGGTITWDGGVTNGTPFTPPAGSTTYTATSSDAGDCELMITIFAGDYPTVDAGADVTFCPGDDVTLTASGTATDWSWDGGVTDGVPFTAPSGTTTYTLTGTIDSTGCEATDMVDVTETVIDNSVTATGSDLMSNQAGAAYQWLECPAMTPVSGETSQTYASVPDGNYAVEVTLDGCIDTSECQLVHVGLTDQDIPVKIYPNPSEGQFQVEMVGTYTYEVTTVQGQVVLRNTANGNEIIDLTSQADGVYLLSIQTNEGRFDTRLIKK